MLVLDTNVLSELARETPDRSVIRWFAGQGDRPLFTTAVCVAEILAGIETHPPGRRRRSVDGFFDQMLRDDLAGRVLPFDFAAAEVYAVLLAERRRTGRPVGQADLQIAAIALHHGATLVTRNTRDFVGYGLDVLDPWSA